MRIQQQLGWWILAGAMALILVGVYFALRGALVFGIGDVILGALLLVRGFFFLRRQRPPAAWASSCGPIARVGGSVPSAAAGYIGEC